jgi:hypothetical protein
VTHHIGLYPGQEFTKRAVISSGRGAGEFLG